MLQFILVSALALSTQPTDERVIAAIAEPGAVRTDFSITKYPVRGSLHPALQWQCLAYYTEVRAGAKVRCAQIVYLDGQRNVEDGK